MCIRPSGKADGENVLRTVYFPSCCLLLSVKRTSCILSNSTLPVFPSARGLDIPSIRTVVNYDVARDIDTHTHRIGRTGRAGEKGVAYTLLTNKDTTFAGDLVRNLEGANQSVSKELMDLAMQVR